ncbi:MAG: aldose 1-epimerase [Rhizomicrobium sp.]
MIALRSGGAVLDLLPGIGGAVSRFAVEGTDVLRPAPAGTADVLQTGCFALVPFANRIAGGVFDFQGETIRLPRNFGDHPHALHGQGWQSAWEVGARSESAATLTFEHAADAWPWDYTAEQSFTLAPRSLRIGLTLVNRSARAMPASLGFHPYFERTPRTVLRAAVDGVWLSDETCIPTRAAGPAQFLDLMKGAPLATAPFVDHCHFGWRGEAIIEQPEHRRVLALTASDALTFLHCFVPQNAGFFCVEPVSAMPDAVHHPVNSSGLRVLAPNESLSVAMTIAVRDR